MNISLSLVYQFELDTISTRRKKIDTFLFHLLIGNESKQGLKNVRPFLMTRAQWSSMCQTWKFGVNFFFSVQPCIFIRIMSYFVISQCNILLNCIIFRILFDYLKADYTQWVGSAHVEARETAHFSSPFPHFNDRFVEMTN